MGRRSNEITHEADMLSGGKIPPQAIDMEEAILGAILLIKEAIDSVPFLKGEHFYLDDHRHIFEACRKLSNDNKPIDILSVVDELKKEGNLDIVGGYAKIAQVTSKVSSAANIEYHAQVIYEKWALREIIIGASESVSECYDGSVKLPEIETKLSRLIDSVSINHGKEAISLPDAASQRLKQIEKAQELGLTITGIDTGFRKFNELTLGWQNSDLIILAARPGQGKSAMMVNIAINVVKQNIPVGIFSLEMSTRQLTERALSILTEINGYNFKKASLDQSQWMRIHNTSTNYPLYIDDTPGLSVNAFKSKARKMKKKYGIRMIMLDYLQLMDAQMPSTNRDGQIGHISRSLKLMAKELDIPIIALAQMSRDIEKRGGDKKPVLSDLRESGNIEQDADIVMFLHDENADDKTNLTPIIDVVFAKHRGGEVGIRTMQFLKQTQKFIDYNI